MLRLALAHACSSRTLHVCPCSCRYADAAKLRDLLKDLEVESKKAQVGWEYIGRKGAMAPSSSAALVADCTMDYLAHF